MVVELTGRHSVDADDGSPAFETLEQFTWLVPRIPNKKARVDGVERLACVCTKLGAPVKDVAVTKPKGYPGPGKSGSYIGLCEYTCARDYCPCLACSYTQSPVVTPTVSEFLPPACVAGAGPGMFGGLCGFSCDFGFCPMNVCTCSRQGPLNPAPAKTKFDATALASLGDDNGLCTFACSHGYCPDDTCSAFDPSYDESEDIDGLDGDVPTIMAHDNYYAKFNTYAEAVVQSAPHAIREFYMDHGKDYFDCQVVEGQTCCGTCWRQYGQGAQQCRYCDGSLCSGNGVRYKNVTEPCPPDFSLRSSVNAANRDGDTIYWTMRGDRVTAFYTDLETSTGISREDTAISAVNHVQTTCIKYPECFGVPVVTAGYNKSDVGNPKEIIANALQSVDHLQGELDATILTLRSYAVRNYSPNDVVDVAALPILMMQQAVESMTLYMEGFHAFMQKCTSDLMMKMRTVWAYGSWQWGTFRQQCPKESRTGETCGLKLVYSPSNSTSQPPSALTTTPQHDGPCGGFTPDFSKNNATDFFAGGDNVATLTTHSQGNWLYRLTVDPAASGNWTQIFAIMQQNGRGDFYEPLITVPASLIGQKAVLGVVTNTSGRHSLPGGLRFLPSVSYER
ncbi:hypothetical protein GE09DRAFT_1056376 [Coniochaeta sp. 2T2.1]|nr:hypothetical protein GE09DRAFT_1056376 [Coniochaeta sp. 2T2.1]